MITDAQFKAWLKDPSSIRCTLVEAQVKLATSGSVVTRYLSSTGYVTGSSDTPANTAYQARVSGGIKFTRSLSLDGQASLSFGDIELLNTDGALDGWLNDYWVNRKLTVLVGDPRWPRSDFRTLFVGTATGIDSRKKDRINIKISDVLQRLNTVVTETKLSDSSLLNDQVKPLCFGECHNITPQLIDGTTNTYMVHNGPIESIIEVRDNGVPVGFIPNLSTGGFTLVASPAGTITASVQGAKFVKLNGTTGYSDRVGDIVYNLMKNYGNVNTRLADVDIDITGMVQFQTTNYQAVGIYLSDRENVLDVCNKILSSVGGRLYVKTDGKVGAVKLTLPWAGATSLVGTDDIVYGSIDIRQVVNPTASVKVGYDRNYTVQANLTTGILPEHAALYAEEWLTKTATDSTVAANYNLFTDPVMQETCLIRTDEATAEANRRLGVYSVQRKVIKFTGLPQLFYYGLGDYVTLTYPRFSLNSGAVGQIISVSMDPMSTLIDFEVLI